jgi:disulfide bond formation protein DsbB
MKIGQEAVIRTPLSREMLALGIAVGLNAAVLVVGYLLVLGGVALSAWLTPRPKPAFHERLAALPAKETIPVSVAEHGRDVFRTVCAACHGPHGFGVEGLGRDLVHSDFVADTDDTALAAFIEQGRPADHPLNKTKVAMPPKGGSPSLTGDDMLAVVAYLRGIQDPRRLPALKPWAPKPIEVTEDDKKAALAAAGGDEELAEYIASGNKIFHSLCVACHGPGGVGITGNGKPLVNNAFVQSLDDDALLAFVKQGRAPTDPKNTTGIQMPPKGGNPAMTDDDILDVIAYLRTLQSGGASMTQAGK